MSRILRKHVLCSGQALSFLVAGTLLLRAKLGDMAWSHQRESHIEVSENEYNPSLACMNDVDHSSLFLVAYYRQGIYRTEKNVIDPVSEWKKNLVSMNELCGASCRW